ncbi:MAG: hypothetical protein LBT50_00580 [Prevotellaceae bacterium]|nr:hypothetical protein [Prevotellaceae bacterium]
MIITPVAINKVEIIAGKYFDLENPHPQIHPNINNVLNNRKSTDRKNESNSPMAMLSKQRLMPENRKIKTINDGKNLNRNEWNMQEISAPNAKYKVCKRCCLWFNNGKCSDVV